MNEIQSSKNWARRGKVYQAKTMAALKELYAPAADPKKPGDEPKGVKAKDAKNAQTAPIAGSTQKAETKKEQPKPNAV
jgi:hypothetical protein